MRLPRISPRGLLGDRRGMAAVEFALIAPTLIVLVMGVMELAFRFRAKEEATRYVHVIADLLSRETSLTTQELRDLYTAAPCMMKPLETASRVDVDISSVGYGAAPTLTPRIYWRRVAGSNVNFTVGNLADMGAASETVVRVGVRYRYSSPISSLFGGPNLSLEEEAITRPRETRIIPIDTHTDENGVIQTFTANAGPALCT
jgi:Flp pilus assembly protein TadG